MSGCEVRAAQRLAERLLAPEGRWAHVRAAGDRAAHISWMVAEGERDLLVCAAVLHDLGYAPAIAHTGFHPLDGARYLSEQGWPARLAGLVAYHSEAGVVADALDLGDRLAAFPRESGLVAAALTYVDMTTGAGGEWVTLPDRLDLMEAGHASDPLAVVAARRDRIPRLFRAVALIESILGEAGRASWRSALFRSEGDAASALVARGRPTDQVTRLAEVAFAHYWATAATPGRAETVEAEP